MSDTEEYFTVAFQSVECNEVDGKEFRADPSASIEIIRLRVVDNLPQFNEEFRTAVLKATEKTDPNKCSFPSDRDEVVGFSILWDYSFGVRLSESASAFTKIHEGNVESVLQRLKARASTCTDLLYYAYALD